MNWSLDGCVGTAQTTGATGARSSVRTQKKYGIYFYMVRGARLNGLHIMVVLYV